MITFLYYWFMKNSIYLIFSIMVLSYLTPLIGDSQIIDNKVNLYAEYVTGINHGTELVKEDDFQYPSLYNNFKDNQGINIKGLYKSRPFLSIGLGMIWLHSSGWEFAEHSDYEGAITNMLSIDPILQFHSKLSRSGFFNRCKVFLEIAPEVGWSGLTLENALFDIREPGGPVSPPMKSTDFFYGIKGTAGMELSVSQSAGMLISYSLGHNWITSVLYCDTQFTCSRLSVGIFLKAGKDKRFFYR